VQRMGELERRRMGLACGLWRSLGMIVDDVVGLRARDDKHQGKAGQYHRARKTGGSAARCCVKRQSLWVRF
jgi:hypothetical protein